MGKARNLIILGIATVLMASVLGIYGLAKNIEKPLTAFLEREINRQLAVPLTMGNVNFSLLHRFPSASLLVDSLIIHGAPPFNDTLVFFERTYLDLDLFSLFDDEFVIYAIEAENGFVHLRVNESGEANYHIFKETDTATALVDINHLQFLEVDVRYEHAASGVNFLARADEFELSGSLAADSFQLETKTTARLHQLTVGPALVGRNIDVMLDAALFVNATTTSISSAVLTLNEELKFNLSGSYRDDVLEMDVKGDELNLISTLALLPQSSAEFLSDYESSGVLEFDMNLSGKVDGETWPLVKLDWAIDGANVMHSPSGWQVSGLRAVGHYTNGERRSAASSMLTISNAEGLFANNPFALSLSLKNFAKPELEAALQLNTDLEALVAFFQPSWLESASGKLWADARLATKLSTTDSLTIADFINPSTDGFVRLGKAVLTTAADQRVVMFDTAAFELHQNLLKVDSCSGVLDACAFRFDGQAASFLDYFFIPDGVLEVDGNLHLGNATNEAVLGPTAAEAKGAFSLPRQSRWRLKLQADDYTAANFKATEISALLTVNAEMAELRDATFKTCGGQVSGAAGLYLLGPNQVGWRAKCTTNGVKMEEAFKSFNDFGQSFIGHRHLSGLANAQMQFQGISDSLLNLDERTIAAEATLEVTEGALTGFAPLIEVADVLKKKPVVSLIVNNNELRKRLADVRFDTLRCELNVLEGWVNLAETEVRSSAVNLNVSGRHSFEHRIHYELDFALSELLEIENRTEPYNEYVSREANGRTRLFLVMDGTSDDFTVEMQRASTRQSLKKELAAETGTVTTLLKKEAHKMVSDSADSAAREKQRVIGIEFNPEADKSTKPTKASAKATTKEQKAEAKRKALEEGDFDKDDF